jgi:hypothetical protein
MTRVRFPVCSPLTLIAAVLPTLVPVVVRARPLDKPSQATQQKPIDFAHDIVPIIKARCAECHTNGKYKGSFSLDTREAMLKSDAIVAGKSGASELVDRITSDDPEFRMPPKGDRLTAKEVKLIKDWIDQKLPWEAGFTFKSSEYVPPLKPRRPELPAARDGRNHPIDRILDEYFAEHRVTPPPALDDAAFIRRAYLDCIGLLPTTGELDAFLSDSAPDKRPQLIRRVLDAKRAYAEHWLTFWNDMLRNDYKGTGYIDGGRKQITAWLYQSLLDNKPYDQFVRELISPSPDSEGFIGGIKWRGRVNASQVLEVQFSQNVSQVFFGINMKCASCHDSFIDRWKLDDAYGLAAVIADEPLEIHRCDKPIGKQATPRFLWPELGEIDSSAPKPTRLEQMAALVTHADNGRFARTIANRIWQRLMGRGIVHPVDVMANRPWNEDLLDYLAVYLADHAYDLKQLIEHITTSRAYQSRHVVMTEEPSNDDYVFQGPVLKRMTAEQFLDAIWMITRSGPAKVVAPIKPPDDSPSTAADRQFVRVALVDSDLLQRSLGRPNREQVVTTRPDMLTTLQALDLANGQILYETLARGAANLLQANPQVTSDQLIESIYVRSLCRRPTTEEFAAARELVSSPPTAESLADLLWIVFMLPEFQLIR